MKPKGESYNAWNIENRDWGKYILDSYKVCITRKGKTGIKVVDVWRVMFIIISFTSRT